MNLTEKDKLYKILTHIENTYDKLEYLVKNNEDFCFHSVVGYDTISKVSYDGEFYYVNLENENSEYEKHDSVYIEGNNVYFIIEIEENKLKLKPVNTHKKIKVGDKVSYAAHSNPFGTYKTLHEIYNSIKNKMNNS